MQKENGESDGESDGGRGIQVQDSHEAHRREKKSGRRRDTRNVENGKIGHVDKPAIVGSEMEFGGAKSRGTKNADGIQIERIPLNICVDEHD